MTVKKTWYEIVAPEMFGSVVIGHTPSFDSKHIIGRNIKVNLTELGKDYNKFYMKLLFKIDSVEGTKAKTKFIGHDITSERIYRMVQRRTRRVDCIADVTTSDGQKIRLKVIAILIKRVGTSVKNKVREKIKKTVEKFVSGITLEVLVQSILKDEFQNLIREESKKIYPVDSVEVRKSELV